MISDTWEMIQKQCVLLFKVLHMNWNYLLKTHANKLVPAEKSLTCQLLGQLESNMILHMQSLLIE